MSASEHRRFSIHDVMILIAGLAAGMGLVRMTSPDLTPGQIREAFLSPRGGWSLSLVVELTLVLCTLVVIPFVAAWTPVCLLLQLARPRAPWRRLRRRPGFVACLIASTVVAVTAAVAVALLVASAWDLHTPGVDGYRTAHLLGGLLAGAGVLSCWVTMRLCGVCRSVPTWRDRLGRFTGAVWLAIGAISACYFALVMG